MIGESGIAAPSLVDLRGWNGRWRDRWRSHWYSTWRKSEWWVRLRRSCHWWMRHWQDRWKTYWGNRRGRDRWNSDWSSVWRKSERWALLFSPWSADLFSISLGRFSSHGTKLPCTDNRSQTKDYPEPLHSSLYLVKFVRFWFLKKIDDIFVCFLIRFALRKWKWMISWFTSTCCHAPLIHVPLLQFFLGSSN